MPLPNFEKECMLYLRNFSAKLCWLTKTVDQLVDAQATLQSSVISLGHANGKAYGQVKMVIDHLAGATNEVVQDLSSAMGTMRCDVWEPTRNAFEDDIKEDIDDRDD